MTTTTHEALKRIKDMTDADNPESYRSDDREGCLDAVFAVASEALAAANAAEGGQIAASLASYAAYLAACPKSEAPHCPESWDAIVRALQANAAEAKLEAVTLESALEAIEHVEQHNGPRRAAEARRMLVRLPAPMDAQPVERNSAGETPTEHAHRWATELAASMAKKHFPEVPQWQPLPDLLGVITQIDNMTTGLVRAQPVSGALDERELPRLPEPAIKRGSNMECGFADCDYFTEDDMTEYARAALSGNQVDAAQPEKDAES